MTEVAILVTLTLGLLPNGSVAGQETTAAVVATGRFELRSDARVALHHFLIDWASADAGEWPPFALPLAERDGWQSVLDDEEQRVWSQAVEAFTATLGRSLLFDTALLAVRDWAAGAATRGAIPPADQALADAIEIALPIYLRHWWPAHDTRNRSWIESVSPTLAAVEEEMIGRLEAAYGARWLDVPVPIDVMVYANPVGAYSTGGRLTISSAGRGNQMPQAVEMIFHESSHMDPLEQPLRAGLANAYQIAGAAAPDRLWHDVIFYTSGELTKLVLADRGQPEYRHYGSLGVYRRGERWSVQLPAFETHWGPFLASGSSDAGARRAALQAFASELLKGQGH